ncbi:MAG TPA: phosphatase PAP2 family protein, partial [Candidatus Berkiella sp.]|nr:phosphatase PAP2 family protein [Candidatus Berkiella sp.]
NVYLKSIWQMPLPAPMEGWAFPSGHMHSAVVFWGALAIEFRRFWFSALIVFMLCLAGYGLVYHGYHYPIDIVGAVGFGSLSLFIYGYLRQKALF